MRIISRQKGFTLTPALFIIVLLIMASATFLVYVRSVGTTERKLEATAVAKYAAETGLSHIKAELGRLAVLGNLQDKWDQAKDFTLSENIFNVSGSSVSKEIILRENINDNNSRVIGEYVVTLEDGELLSGINKTITGSATAGKDIFGNQIWNNSTDKNMFTDLGFYRFGVRVDGYALNGSGKRVPGGQAVYAVLNIPISPASIDEENISDNPAGYLLATNGVTDDPNDPYNGRLYLFSNQLITGPVHSNEQVNFYWKGNFQILNNSNATKQKLSSYNNKYTISATRFNGANTWDPPPPIISEIRRETNGRLTIYGQYFNPVIGNNEVKLGSTLLTVNSASYTKLVVTLPPNFDNNPPPAPADLIVGNKQSFAVAYVPSINTLSHPVPNPTPTPIPPATDPIPDDLSIYGVMQLSEPGTLNDKVYIQGTDYRFVEYDDPNTEPIEAIPYIAWDLPGDEPAPGTFYRVTYLTKNNIPHRRINVLGPITYSGIDTNTGLPKTPKYYYEHSHKAPGTSYYPWTETHNHVGNIFGGNFNLLNATDPTSYLRTGVFYDWDTPHLHEIQSSLINAYYGDDNDNLFFYWKKSGYKPTLVPRKVSPVLKPNNFNYYTQREQINQIYKMILGKELIRDRNGKLQDPEIIPEDRANGYYIGSQDFRGVYFGNELKFSAGAFAGQYVIDIDQPITATAGIYVNESPGQDYLKIAKEAVNSNYKYYTYRQIPKNAPTLTSFTKIVNGVEKKEAITVNGGIILVRDGVVQIGARYYNDRNGTNRYANASSTFGSKTIIDGRLTIYSYSETKPSQYIDTDLNSTTDNTGDIIITGDIIYKNTITPTADEIASDMSDKKISVSDKFDGIIQLAKNSDGETVQVTDEEGNLVHDLTKGVKLCSLGLYASNDIKIPVGHYYQDSSENVFNSGKADRLTIHAQLIAGHQITQTKAGSSNNSSSKNDQLVMLGSYYSENPPNLGYFDREDPDKLDKSYARIYIYDKLLTMVPLSGTPFFPKNVDYTPDQQYIAGLNLPVIVPGSWQSLPAN